MYYNHDIKKKGSYGVSLLETSYKGKMDRIHIFILALIAISIVLGLLIGCLILLVFKGGSLSSEGSKKRKTVKLVIAIVATIILAGVVMVPYLLAGELFVGILIPVGVAIFGLWKILLTK